MTHTIPVHQSLHGERPNHLSPFDLQRRFGMSPALPHRQAATLAERILAPVMSQRRLISGHEACTTTPCSTCMIPHVAKVNALIEQGLPIHFILPAFPAKSPNLSKVLGPLPDLGERLSLLNLNKLCQDIGELYAPGATMTICSDGRVFADCVGVSDDDVSRYGEQIRQIINQYGCKYLNTFNLEDHFSGGDFSAIRRDLIEKFGRSVDELRQRIAIDPESKSMFNGIHRFMHTDLKARQPHLSNNKLREAAKHLAYHVIIRSNAWSELVEGLFPNALRLSIHPQHPHSRKIGIKLIESDDVWRTPWHAAVLDDGQTYRLMTREDIEKLPVDLVYERGRPLYYALKRHHQPARPALERRPKVARQTADRGLVSVD